MTLAILSEDTWGSLQHTIILSKRRYVVLLVITMVINVDFIVEYYMYTDSTNVNFIFKAGHMINIIYRNHVVPQEFDFFFNDV